MAGTYSNITFATRDKLRIYLKDYDSGITQDTQTLADPIWQDGELDMFLLATGQNIFLAAANALLAELTDKVRTGNIIKLGAFGDNEAVVAQNMLMLERRYRVMGGISGLSTTTSISAPNSTVILARDSDSRLDNLW